MKMKRLLVGIGLIALLAASAYGAELPAVRLEHGASQLIVHGQPFLALGGELGNSSAGTEAQADAILPRLAAMHVNTVLMPVAWDQLEPTEGTYDFRILDHWIATARANNIHLVLLWFGSWKNAFSNYAPAWVKADTARFPRARAIDGAPLDILSTFGAETLRLDSRAFSALMARVRKVDLQQTVLMVQVENEVGYLGDRRDRSTEADRAFNEAVPSSLVQALLAKRNAWTPELAAHFHPEGHTWKEVFGDAADEAFMTWRYATYIDAVAQAGKAQYSLPMYVNTQLPAPAERAGEYPSGGSYPSFQQIYRAAAPHIDFYSPDIYWPEFAYWVQRYQTLDNPVFVPEAKIESAPYNALYAYGEAKAFGFCPFGIDSLRPPTSDKDATPLVMQVYGALNQLGALLPQAQLDGRTRGLVLHASSPRPTQTVSLGGYLFEATLSRSWPQKTLLSDDGAVLVLESKPDEFYIVGSGLTVSITRDSDVDDRVAGIASIEEVSKLGAGWKVLRRLNGDQSNQGRQLSMDPHEMRIYRVRLYAIAR
ncbi:DUF5597 domain-containing protein [Dyella sp. 2HG41-7]|uniref:GH35 family beta-galactosidase n=1 Tax=Dyella sp. 2HG41-7 TaxID=2883239 RepID=UPI001F302247|nr:DUF5597 domain-containing protein [Dyella sp. 2HG41-7]